MEKEVFAKIEQYMLECMKDGAHDEQHIYRVLYFSLDIAENNIVDNEVLIASALLHDIGREAQFKDKNLDHAIIGSEMAYKFIIDLGWDTEKANHIKNCIRTHRYRKNCEPDTMEAKILFDADKLDATGTMGIARTLAYKGIVAEPLYVIDENGKILNGINDTEPSFFREYNFKLKKLYDGFYTERAKEIGKERQRIAKLFYESMLKEVSETYEIGRKKLENELT
jgi:uncharacterized protein